MILRTCSSLILTAVLSIGLSACGATEDYETSNGSILWSDYKGFYSRTFSPDTGVYGMEALDNDLGNGQRAHNIVRTDFDGKREIIATVEPIIPMDIGQTILLVKDEEEERIVVVGAAYSSDKTGFSTVQVTSIDTTTINISSYTLYVSNTLFDATYVQFYGLAQDYGGRLIVRIGADAYEISPSGLSLFRPGNTPEGLDIPDIPEGTTRTVVSGLSQGMYVRIDYAEPETRPEDYRYTSATVSAYDEEYNLIWREELEHDSPLNYYYFSGDAGTRFNDVGLWRGIKHDWNGDGCKNFFTTISETGLGDIQKIKCDETTIYTTDESFYFKYEQLAEDNAFLISKMNLDNEIIEDYTFQYDPSVDSADLITIRLLDNGKLYVKFETFKDTTSSTTPENADEDFERQTTILILNEDLSLFSEIPIIKYRKVYRIYNYLPFFGYVHHYSDSTPDIGINDVNMSNENDIIFWGQINIKSRIISSRMGAIH
jgi:hypothetical protein